jgi:SAM-dependent methyltransferase
MIANAWNRIRYTLYTPVYDAAIATFDAPRRRAIDQLGLRAGEHALIVGAGSGRDLHFIPPGVQVTATDLTPAMVALTRAKAAALSRQVTAQVMDGQALDLPDAAFDAVLLHLILAVIPDPIACIREAARVLKPGGRISVFDKFLTDARPPSLARRLVNIGARVAATDINRRLEPIARAGGLCIAAHDVGARLIGLDFHVALLRQARSADCPSDDARVQSF